MFVTNRHAIFFLSGGNNNIRCYAECLNGSPQGRKVSSRGQSQPVIITQRQNSLNGTFAKAFRAEKQGPTVILQGPCYDLGCTGTAAVNQDDQRIIRFSSALLCTELQLTPRFSTFGINNQTFLQKEIGHIHRLIKEPSAIISQVKNQALQSGGILLVQAVQFSGHLRGGRRLKLGNPQITITGFKGSGTYADNLDHIALHGKIFRDIKTVTHDRQRH